MRRPYGLIEDDYPMYVVRHYDGNIQLYMREVHWDLSPAHSCNLA